MSLIPLYQAGELTSAPPRRQLPMNGHDFLVVINRSAYWLAISQGANLQQIIPAWSQSGFPIPSDLLGAIHAEPYQQNNANVVDFEIVGVHGVWYDPEAQSQAPYVTPLVIATHDL